MQKLADSNIWLALTLSKHSWHQASRVWLEQMNAGDLALFCRSTQQTYLRLLTTAEVLAPYGIAPLSNAEAWAMYEGWLASGCAAFISEPRTLDAHWKTLAVRKTASPKVWMDSYLAAFAMSGGYQLVTTDKGFKQYKGLDLEVLAES